MKNLNKATLLAFAILMQPNCLRAGEAWQPKFVEPRGIRFCSAVTAIQPGDVLSVEFAGILTAGGEFFDHLEPRCKGVGLSSHAEPAPDFEYPKPLLDLLRKEKSAFVMVTGQLFGPGLGKPDDLSVREMPAFFNLRKLAGYGYNGLNRTKLVIHEVMAAWPTSDALLHFDGVKTSPFPRLVAASVPLNYPTFAFNLELEGDVKVQLSVEDGIIVHKEVLSGDRMLVPETLQTLETWQFESKANARFTTTFSYRIGPILPGATSVSVHSDLPLRVEVVAPRRDW